MKGQAQSKKTLTQMVALGLATLLMATTNNAQTQSEAEKQSQASAQTPGERRTQIEFEEVDTNRDNQLSWQELKRAYERDITAVGLTENQLIQSFDQNQDRLLDGEEYRAFTSGFMQRQVYSLEDVEAPQDTTRDTKVAVGDAQPSGEQALKPDTQNHPLREEQQSQKKDDTVVAIVGVTRVQDVPVERIADRPVINLEGKNIGNVDDIVRTKDGTSTGLVVTTGGIFGIGEKEVVIDVNEVHITEDKVVWEETDATLVDELPEYNGQDYVSVR